jgi:hypothetical protein
MRITYTIQVCNESRELFSLLNFLGKVIDDEDNVHVVVDAKHKTEKVDLVLKHFEKFITVFERPFDNFYENSKFHSEKATGDYVFLIDADEMPQEMFIKNLKHIINETGGEIIAIPRINLHPGSTQDFIEKSNFNVNEMGWINWPDYQKRIFKKCEHITWSDTLHTTIVGSDKVIGVQADPRLAMWHIKSIEKQTSRWVDHDIRPPSSENIYDLLM